MISSLYCILNAADLYHKYILHRNMYVARLPPSFISVIEVQNVNYNHDLVTARVCIELQLQTTVLINFAWNQIIFPKVKIKFVQPKACSLAAI